jgi:uncharacterized membrane protein YdjX (TVP38/TMEM64 family)
VVGASGRWGAILFFALQLAIAASGIVPASLLGMAAGAVYGIGLGFAVSAAGTLAGAWLAFRLARSLFRGRVERLLADRPRLRNLDARLGRETWRLVCLLRVSPVMPFAVTSYTLGLSSVSPGAYMLGSLAAMPALLGYVVLGSIAHAGLQAGQGGAGPFRWTILAVGFAATAALTLRVGRLVKLALDGAGDGIDPVEPLAAEA